MTHIKQLLLSAHVQRMVQHGWQIIFSHFLPAIEKEAVYRLSVMLTRWTIFLLSSFLFSVDSILHLLSFCVTTLNASFPPLRPPPPPPQQKNRTSFSFTQSEEEPKPILSGSNTFSRALATYICFEF